MEELKDIEKLNIIRSVVSEYYSLTLQEVARKTRKRNIVTPRQVTYYFIKKHTKISLEKIGDKIAGQDHSTVMHALKCIEDLIVTDKNIRIDVDIISKKIEDAFSFDVSRDFFTQKYVLFKNIRTAPTGDIMNERILKIIGLSSDELYKKSSEEIEVLKNDIQRLQQDEHPLIVKLKSLSSEEMDFVLNTRIDPYLRMNSKF